MNYAEITNKNIDSKHKYQNHHEIKFTKYIHLLLLSPITTNTYRNKTLVTWLTQQKHRKHRLLIPHARLDSISFNLYYIIPPYVIYPILRLSQYYCPNFKISIIFFFFFFSWWDNNRMVYRRILALLILLN